MNFGIRNTPMNSALVSTVGARIRADAKLISATSAFWWLAGIGALLLMIGGGIGLATFGYNYATDRNAKTLATALADALNRTTLKTDGKVVLDTDGATVKLDSNGVKLDTSGATVTLDTRGSVVRLDTSGLTSWRPTEQQLGSNIRPTSNVKPVTNYTVFHHVQFAHGEVVTGWSYKSNEDNMPSRQFCYYSQDSDADQNTSTKYNLGTDGVKVPSVRGIPVNLDQAFANCVWWR